MKKLIFTLCAVFCAVMFSFEAGAQDQGILKLKDGTEITGIIERLPDGGVRVTNADGDTFVFSSDDIARVSYGKSKEPGEKRTFGLSVGYVGKQLKDNDGEKYPWCSAKDESGSSAALRLGLYWAPEFRWGLGLQTGLYYEMSMSKVSEDGVSVSMSEHALSIPLRVQYRYEIIRDLSVFIYTGPSFDISMAYNIKASYMGETEKYSIYDDSDMSRFHLQWGVGAGVRWKGLQLMLGGDWGLTKVFKGEDPYETKLNKPFSISLTYLF